MSLTIERVEVASLKTDPNNLRVRSARNLEAITVSLAKYGQQKPIVVDRDGIVRAGNGTLEAARALGWQHIDVVYTQLSGSDAAAFALADNRSAQLAEWDVEALADWVSHLGNEQAAQLGFTAGDVEELFDLKANPFTTMKLPIAELKPHPKNYQTHPDDQLAHIIRSIETHGFYRNVVVARDNTILAGHGVVQAAAKMGKTRVPVVRLDLDPNDPRALKVLTSDNEINNLAEVDDRALTELLKVIMQTDQVGLQGTGFNEQQLAALTFVTRPESEVADINEAAEQLGLPAYEPLTAPMKIVVSFENEEARNDFAQRLGLTLTEDTRATWWPPRERDDPSSLRVEG